MDLERQLSSLPADQIQLILNGFDASVPKRWESAVSLSYRARGHRVLLNQLSKVPLEETLKLLHANSYLESNNKRYAQYIHYRLTKPGKIEADALGATGIDRYRVCGSSNATDNPQDIPLEVRILVLLQPPLSANTSQDLANFLRVPSTSIPPATRRLIRTGLIARYKPNASECFQIRYRLTSKGHQMRHQFLSLAS
jgi:hypothetical protein